MDAQIVLKPAFEHKDSIKISTGVKSMDQILRGGLPTNGIVEICGESGTGKTQFCLQLSVNALSARSDNSYVLYISTQHVFPIKRLHQIISHLKGNKTNIEPYVLVEHAADCEALVQSLSVKLVKFLESHSVVLLVIDSIAALFRGSYTDGHARTRDIREIGKICFHLNVSRLGVKVGGCFVSHKTNRETMVEISDSVRGKDVYIVQTGTKDPNNNIMELLIMAYACKTSSAKSIVGVIPYLPYSKQCKMRKRGCIVAKLLAKMISRSGLTHVITMDLHQKEVQGFFDCPVDNLRASPFLLQYIQECIPDYRNAVMVARNPNSAKKATSYAERLRLGIAVIHGEQKESEADEVDGRNSPPVVPRSRTMEVPDSVPIHPAKEKPPMNVVGDVGGRIAIMVDDIADDMKSFVAAAEVLKERGAYKIYVLATHGLLSSDAPALIEDSPIDEVVVTNTVPHELQKMQCHKIKTVDISLLLSEAIRRIHNKESMSYLFKNITLED